jgi:hypothetical protein
MSCYFLLDASPYSPEFVVATRLLALEHEATGQAGALDGINKTVPCLGTMLLLLNVRLVQGEWASLSLSKYCLVAFLRVSSTSQSL